MALNLSRSGLRRLRVERRAREGLPAAPAGEPSPLRVDVERSVASLPRRQREVTVLHYFLGLDRKEIAEILRVHEGTVKATLHRARAALAGPLGEPITRRRPTVSLDDRVRRGLDEVAPADPSGAYERVVEKKIRRRFVRRTARAVMSIGVVAVTALGFLGSRASSSDRRTLPPA